MTPEDIKHLNDLAVCRNCLGRGKLYPQCGFCADSTHDHECPKETVCRVCKGTGRIGAVVQAIAVIKELESVRSSLAEILARLEKIAPPKPGNEP